MSNETSPMMNKAMEVKSNISDLGSMAVNAARDGASNVRQSANELYEQGLECVQDATDCSINSVKENPVTSILVATGVGIVLGFLLARSCSK